MISPFLLLILPVGLALGLLLLPRIFPGWLLCGCYLLGAAMLLPVVAAGETLIFSVNWVSQLGMNFALRMTPFSAWFGFLIFTIGAGILLYTASYFRQNPRLKSILSCLLLFTTAMLGVIWADNFFLLFLFWEATSLISFLLVGFNNEKEETRASAAQALLVTFLGGAAMLAGFILLRMETNVSTISSLLEGAPTSGPLLTTAVVLIILGALTKSAQFPFHFWLPNAMAGPTPVSAFLHSATMVKAGVFLLATLAPALGAHPVWTPTLVTLGLLTVAVSTLKGLREDDVKGILASTTLTALGLLTVLAGIGTTAALKAFVIFLTAHALYKAPLFLSAGNLEKRFGTRLLSKLQGAIRTTPITGPIIVISTLSLLGIPPFPGFLGKEYLLAAAWEKAPLIAGATAITAAGALCLGLHLLLPLLAKRNQAEAKTSVPIAMSIATAIPAIAVLSIIVLYPWVNAKFLVQAATSLGGEPVKGFSFWHGFTPALGLGLSALLIAVIAHLILRKTDSSPFKKSLFEEFYEFLLNVLLRLSKEVSKLLENGALHKHLAFMLVVIGALSLFSLKINEWPSLDGASSRHSAIFIALAPALAIATIAAARAQKPLAILVSLGFVGLLIAFLFLWFSAPDLALTQLLAETLIIFLMAGVLFKARNKPQAQGGQFWRIAIAGAGGLLVTMLILKSMALEWDHPVSDYYLTESKTAAYGANVVNVILVDFRALDTFGEIIVLAIAALGANAALGAARSRAPLPKYSCSRWLDAGLPLVVALLIPTSMWIFWRGHNAPGGGFIAALLVASAIGLGLLKESPLLRVRRMRALSRNLLTTGLTIALFSSLIPLTQGLPYFTGLWYHSGDFHLGTPVLFDLGVFLTVIGFTVSFLRHFHISQDD